MKIARLETVVVYGPRRRVYGRVYRGMHGLQSHSEHGLIFLHTDSGIVGVGEISSVFARKGKAFCRDVDDMLASTVIGADPFDFTRIVRAIDRALPGAEQAKAGIEMALWDVLGKALDLPVYKLLGGKVRDSIPLSYSVSHGNPEDMAALAKALVAQGFRTIKVKVGQGADEDLAAVRLVRQAIGDEHRLRVDANMAWPTASEAVRNIRRLETFNLELVEQPLPARDLDAVAEVRKRVDVPIMLDESVWTPRDAIEVVRHGAADIVNVYVSEAGGIHNAARILDICETAGIQGMIGSMPEFGIGTAAQIHLGVAAPNVQLDSDTCGVLYHEEDLLVTPLRIENGHAYPPEGPGLGVEVDMAVVERWRTPPSSC